MVDSVLSSSESAHLLDLVQDLQVRLSYQEDSIQSLNDVVAQQDATIAQMKEQLRFFAEKVKTMESSVGASGDEGGDERPPHY